MAAEEVSIHRELAALREGQAHLAEQLDLLRRETREDFRDLRAQIAAVQQGQLAFAAATVAGLLGVIATLIVQL